MLIVRATPQMGLTCADVLIDAFFITLAFLKNGRDYQFLKYACDVVWHIIEVSFG
jgi:hypothetical protein